MFYCDECAKLYGWPIGFCRSLGPCECCKKTRTCSDVPSSQLPRSPGCGNVSDSEQ